MNWIPRTEREPDTGDHVIITVKWSDADYEVMEDDWGCTVAEVNDGTATPIVQEMYKRMIAWMPMPKPYRGKNESKTVD